MRLHARALVALAVASVVASACRFPRDASGTLDAVLEEGRVLVGVVELEPWAVRDGGDWRGVEVELVRRLAEDLGASVEWVPGTESEVLAALEVHAVDLAIGGLTTSNPWGSKVTFTPPHVTTTTVVGVPAGTDIPAELDGVRVVVERGTESEDALRATGADVVPVEEVARGDGPAAVEDWRLDDLGLEPTRHRLLTEDHVLAVPKGENAWLVRVEDFVDVHRAVARTLLEEVGER